MAKRMSTPIKSTPNIIDWRVHVHVAHGSVEQGGRKS